MVTTSDEQSPIQQGYKSGEAARLAKMPVTTLRIWERRYGVIGPAKTASGQRLYTEDDVRRLTLIKMLVSRGHAIGAIARLDREQLQFLASRNAREGDGPAGLWRRRHRRYQAWAGGGQSRAAPARFWRGCAALWRERTEHVCRPGRGL
nr:MerR family transcriptional regulator [Paraburkholderia bryophila]